MDFLKAAVFAADVGEFVSPGSDPLFMLLDPELHPKHPEISKAESKNAKG
jgi:hypothetical protein